MPKGQGCASDLVTLRTSMVVARRRRDAYQDSQIYRVQLRSWWGNRRGFNSKAGSFKIGQRIKVALMDIVELDFAVSKVSGGCEVPAKVGWMTYFYMPAPSVYHA